MDLEVTNINQPDSERALSNTGDVIALLSASYHSWFEATHQGETWVYATPGFSLSNQSFQHASPWANAGMEYFGRIPRQATPQETSHFRYTLIAYPWDRCYRSISALANGLRAIEDPEVAADIPPNEFIRLRAYGKFVQGLTHGTVALLYARGFILDETTDLTQPQHPVDYHALMDQALAYLDQSITLAGQDDFSIPYDWMQADLNSQGLIRLAHSYKARFRAQVARTPEERAAVEWVEVIADVDAGIQETHTIEMDWDTGWYSLLLDYGTYHMWSQLPYFIYGMADQAGAVAEWYALSPTEDPEAGVPGKSHMLPDGRPVLIVTPDLRFPQGSTIEEQRAQEGRFFRIAEEFEEGGAYSSWKKPERGTWRWSWYKAGSGRGFDYYPLSQQFQPETTLAEMRLLKAEGLFWLGDKAGAATILNETRVAAGLNPTDAAGANSSCVPKLPNGSCGDLWEMLKWEKRMETVWTGIAASSWFFDGRGWGDLWKDTPLQFPIPCGELEVLEMTPCPAFGGPGGQMGSPGSTYNFPFER